ncbi:hypothetical protein, partial [Bacillus smithii]|uniref:hypothetical protein n=1 Tax=Bacillus smithii TaxID=1479 RepID=UPI003D25B60A
MNQKQPVINEKLFIATIHVKLWKSIPEGFLRENDRLMPRVVIPTSLREVDGCKEIQGSSRRER